MDAAPNAVVVCSRPAKTFIKEIINRDFECIVAGDGVTLDLGNKTIEFISAPYLHWPDSIFTYVKEDAFLSSGDVFGFHYSAGQIFDDLTKLDAKDVYKRQAEYAPNQDMYEKYKPFQKLYEQSLKELHGFYRKIQDTNNMGAKATS